MPVPFCSDPLKFSFDLASQLIAVISRAKNVSLCKTNVVKVPSRLRHVAHVALSRCISCAERRGLADCPTYTRSNARDASYPIARKVGQQDGATPICFASFANRRGNAAGWLLWPKTPKIARFGFVCPSTG
jgi:hypothetical protein